MKRYNLSQIMKDAHRLYNNEYQRKGRSWGECLQAAWRWAKDAAKVRAEKEAKLQAMIDNLTWFDCYNSNSKGYMGSQYCGD